MSSKFDYVDLSVAFIDGLVKSRKTVTPAKAGVHNILECLDSRFRGNDRKEAKRTFYGLIFIALPQRICRTLYFRNKRPGLSSQTRHFPQEY